MSPANLPVQAAGIALNIVAIALLLHVLIDVHPEWEWLLQPTGWALIVESLALQALLLLRAMTVVRARGKWDLLLRQELASRRMCAGWAAYLIAVQITWARLYPFFGLPASVVVHTAAVLQYATCARFLYNCVRKRSPPEPFWFPATVSLAAIAIVGPGIGSPQVVCMGAAMLGCLVAVLLWPPCVYRVLRHPTTIAADPSVFVMMAPVPFVTLALFAQRREAHVPLLGDGGMDALFLLNVVNLIVTFAAAAQRRMVLWRSLRPLSPAWASLTFPLTSNCTVAVKYAIDYNIRSAAAQAYWVPWVSAHWSAMLVPITLVLVPCTDVLWMFFLPNWYFFDRPRRPPSVDEGDMAQLLPGSSTLGGREMAAPPPGLSMRIEPEAMSSHEEGGTRGSSPASRARSSVLGSAIDEEAHAGA